MTGSAAQNLGILYPEAEDPKINDEKPLPLKAPIDDVFEEDEKIADTVQTFEGIHNLREYSTENVQVIFILTYLMNHFVFINFFPGYIYCLILIRQA